MVKFSISCLLIELLAGLFPIPRCIKLNILDGSLTIFFDILQRFTVFLDHVLDALGMAFLRILQGIFGILRNVLDLI